MNKLRAPATVILFWLSAIVAGMASASCAGRVVRVPVSDEDAQQARFALKAGDLAFSRKDYYAALIQYLEGSRYNPNDEVLLNRLGVAYAQLKLYRQARETLLRAVRLQPDFSHGYNNLGSIYFLQKNLKKAEAHFLKAIRLNDREASFHINLGSLYLERKRPRDAIASWRRALEIDPLALSKSSSIQLTRGGRTSPMERSYLMARLYALDNNVDMVIQSLKQSFSQGFADVDAIRRQPDFDIVRENPRFVDFVSELDLLIRLRDRVGLAGQ